MLLQNQLILRSNDHVTQKNKRTVQSHLEGAPTQASSATVPTRSIFSNLAGRDITPTTASEVKLQPKIQKRSSNMVVAEIQPNDITLFRDGRGGPVQNEHQTGNSQEANKSFEALINELEEEYNAGDVPDDGKYEIIARAIDSVVNRGGRFLCLNEEGQWTELKAQTYRCPSSEHQGKFFVRYHHRSPLYVRIRTKLTRLKYTKQKKPQTRGSKK